MATYQKRSKGKSVRALVRRVGFPGFTKTLPTRDEAQRWARSMEQTMKLDQKLERLVAELEACQPLGTDEQQDDIAKAIDHLSGVREATPTILEDKR